MAEEQTPTSNMSAPAAAPAPVESAAPVSTEVVVPSAPNPTVTESTTAAASTTPATAETTASAPAGATEVKIENPLGEVKPEVKKTEEKPVEKVSEVKAPEPVKVELPTYEPFKTPEHVKLEGESLGEFTKLLAEIETGKLDHKGYQEYGQKLVDYGTKLVTDSITRLNDSYVQIHQGNQKARFEALKADPELGGDKLPETISTLQRSIAEYGGSEAQVADFRKEVTEAGLGASPAICRLIHNMQQKINKYTTEQGSDRNVKGTDMVPGAKPAPSKVKDYQKFYS